MDSQLDIIRSPKSHQIAHFNKTTVKSTMAYINYSKNGKGESDYSYDLPESSTKLPTVIMYTVYGQNKIGRELTSLALIQPIDAQQNAVYNNCLLKCCKIGKNPFFNEKSERTGT